MLKRLCMLMVLALGQSASRAQCAWEPLGPGVDGYPARMAVFDDGSGPALYVSGSFMQVAGNASVRNIARWNGEEWSAVGGGIGDLGATLLTYDDGSGEALYAAGGVTIASSFVAKWDGKAWSVVGEGIPANVPMSVGIADLCAFDDGTGMALYAGGDFSGTAGTYITRWDGASWTQVGTGVNEPVRAMTVFDDGAGAALYIATSPRGSVIASFWRWDGAAWTKLADETDDYVADLHVFDDGGGDKMYAAGQFTHIGGVTAHGLARFDGATWEPARFNSGPAWRLTTFGAGAGAALYIAGMFSSAGAVPANNVAMMSSGTFSALGQGLNDNAQGLCVFDGALHVVGQFTEAGGQPAMKIARWKCASCYPDCDTSGALDILDFLCFQDAFVTMNPYADCDNSTTFDIFDFLCFQDAFIQGCP